MLYNVLLLKLYPQ